MQCGFASPLARAETVFLGVVPNAMECQWGNRGDGGHIFSLYTLTKEVILR